jgi:hypothetical protein
MFYLCNWMYAESTSIVWMYEYLKLYEECPSIDLNTIVIIVEFLFSQYIFLSLINCKIHSQKFIVCLIFFLQTSPTHPLEI